MKFCHAQKQPVFYGEKQADTSLYCPATPLTNALPKPHEVTT